MSEMVRQVGPLVLALVFVVCIWLSRLAVNPKRRAALVCTAALGTAFLVYISIKEVARSQAAKKGGTG